jgi:hypothetical protein
MEGSRSTCETPACDGKHPPAEIGSGVGLHFFVLYMLFGQAGNRRFWGVWAASAAPKIIPEGGGLRPRPSGMVFGAAGAAHIPKIIDFRPAQQPCIKNPSVRS